MNASPAMKQSQHMRMTIPIKIMCGCGQKYAFDVEPMSPRMGFTVQCPVCGIDGTAATNQLIEQHLATQSVSSPGLRIGGLPSPPPMPPDRPREAFTCSIPSAILPIEPTRSKGPVVLVCAVIALVLLSIVALLFNRRPKPDLSTSAATSNDGLPKTPAELNAWYVEPAQNAARFYSQGFEALQLDNVESSNIPLFGQGKLPPLGSPTPPFQKSAMAAIVRANGAALQFFAQGTELEQSRYPINLSLGWDLTLPHIAALRRSTLLMQLAAILHAEAKDGKQAGNDVLIALGLARSLEAEPALMSQSVRATATANAVAALEQTISRISLPKESLSELLKTLQKMEDNEARGEGFTRAIIAERTTSMALLGAPQKLLQAVMGPGIDLPAGQREQIIALLKKGRSLKKEQQYFENAFQQFMEIRRKFFPDRLEADALLRRRVGEAGAKKLLINGMLLPGLAGRASREAASLASLRLGLTAVAIQQFRAANSNRYPAALSELTPDYLPATPADPFDGQPLRYRGNGSGYTIYSIGPNLRDDSGERTNGKEGDIVFELNPPPR